MRASLAIFYDSNALLFAYHLRVQPQPVLQPLFAGTEHLVHPLAASVEMESRRVPDVLGGLWAVIDVGIHKGEFGEFGTQVAKCREYLAANMAPRCTVVDNCRSFGSSDLVKNVL